MSGDTCVLTLTRAAGYNDSLSFALHPDGSNHDWVYDATEGKESLILWSTVNLTDISVIHALSTYLSMCKELTKMTELHRNYNNSNDNNNSKLNMTVPKYFSEADLKSFHNGDCYHCPGFAGVKSKVQRNDMAWPRSLRWELFGDFELSDTRRVWLLAPGRRHLVLHWEVFMSALHGSFKERTHPEMVEARGGTCFGCVPSSVLVLFWEYEDDE